MPICTGTKFVPASDFLTNSFLPHPRTKQRAPLPSRQELLAFIDTQTGKAGTREIARAFGLKNADRAWLKQMLRDLADEGRIEQRRKKLHHPGTLPSTVAAGIGDRALLRVEETGEQDEAICHTGRVIKILDRGKQRVLGVFRALPNGGGRLTPVDKKQLGRELTIAPGAAGDAQDGDLVAVEVAPQGRFGPSSGRVKEKLGSLASERAVSLIAIHAHGIPHVFPREALADAEAAAAARLTGREDWRQLPLITIDPAD